MSNACEQNDTEYANFAHLLSPTSVQNHVRLWLQEDLPAFDYGGFVVGEKDEQAVLLCKSKGILAGVPFFTAVFQELGCTVEWNYPEGGPLVAVCAVAVVKGKVNKILMGERLALNCLCRASGIATKARNLITLKTKHQWHGEIAATRKTTPGFRLVEKYAAFVGGASTHRYDQSSMIMLKDNHIWSSSSVINAVKSARKAGGFSIKIEVECRSVDEARSAACAGADIVMLDNFSPETLHKSAKILKEEFPSLLIEASGGIMESNIVNYFGSNIDVISIGSITQGYQPINFSLKIIKDGRDPQNPLVTT